MRLMQKLAEENNLRTIRKLLEMSSLADELESGDSFTLFAPRDKAFAGDLKNTFKFLAMNPEILNRIMKFHLVSGTILSKNFIRHDYLESLEGGNLEITYGVMQVRVNQSYVISPDNKVDNGVFHLIDSVLLPDDLKGVLLK